MSALFDVFRTFYSGNWTLLTLLRLGLFGAAHIWGGGKKAPLPYVSYNHKTRHSYTLPKEDPKIYKSCYTLLEFCYHHQLFLSGNPQIFLYPEIQI